MVKVKVLVSGILLFKGLLCSLYASEKAAASHPFLMLNNC